MAVIHKYLRMTKKYPHVWCSGCSNGIVLNALIRAIDRLELHRNDVVLVSGIGCSSRAPVYVDFNTLHTTHGRALPFATGIKLAKPHLKLIIITGDGDALAIGGNHFIHTCKRNIDMTVLVFNNYNYGMTGGQRSPTTPTGTRTTTSIFGARDNPFDVCNLAIGAGATFVARTTAYHARPMENLIEKGIMHRGLSVIEVRSNCPVIFGRLNRLGNPVKMMMWYKENSYPIEKLRKLPKDERKKVEHDKVIIGILKQNYEIPEYTERYKGMTDMIARQMHDEEK